MQADIESSPVRRQPSIPARPAPAPAPPVSPRASPRQTIPAVPAADVHVVVSDQAGRDTIKQSFEPPPPPPPPPEPVTHVISDMAGSQTIRDSFEPPLPPTAQFSAAVEDGFTSEHVLARATDMESLLGLSAAMEQQQNELEQRQQYNHVMQSAVMAPVHRPAPVVPERPRPPAPVDGCSRLMLRQGHRPTPAPVSH